MQIITDVRAYAQRFVEENATTILTAGGVVGTVTTAVLAWRGGVKYSEVVDAEIQNQYKDMHPESPLHELPFIKLTKMDKVQLALPYLAPPVITGSTTVAAIIFAHKMNAQKAAALAAAYGLTQKQLEEYKNKVAEKLGVQKEQKLQDELAQERVNNTPGSSQIVVMDGEVLCFDQPSGRYFRSSMDAINKAVNATNAEILQHDYANAAYFYEELGLPAAKWADEVGWNTNQQMGLSFSTVMSDDDRPCIAIDFKTVPKLDYISVDY